MDENLVLINDLEKKYVGKEIKNKKFLSIFELNGSQTSDYRYYFDFDDLMNIYEDEDPRPMDFDQDDDETEEEYDERCQELPYPDLSLFITIQDVEKKKIISEFNICKIYSTGNYTAGRHASNLLPSEVGLIENLLSSFIVVK